MTKKASFGFKFTTKIFTKLNRWMLKRIKMISLANALLISKWLKTKIFLKDGLNSKAQLLMKNGKAASICLWDGFIQKPDFLKVWFINLLKNHSNLNIKKLICWINLITCNFLFGGWKVNKYLSFDKTINTRMHLLIKQTRFHMESERQALKLIEHLRNFQKLDSFLGSSLEL